MIDDIVNTVGSFLTKYVLYNSQVVIKTIDKSYKDKNGKTFLVLEENTHISKRNICKVYSIKDSNGKEYAIPNDVMIKNEWNPCVFLGKDRSIGIVKPGNVDFNSAVGPFTVKYSISGISDKVSSGQFSISENDYGLSIDVSEIIPDDKYLNNGNTEYYGISEVNKDMYIEYKDNYSGKISIYVYASSGLERDILTDEIIRVFRVYYINDLKKRDLITLELLRIYSGNPKDFMNSYVNVIEFSFEVTDIHREEFVDDVAISNIGSKIYTVVGEVDTVIGRLYDSKFDIKTIKYAYDDWIAKKLVEGYVSQVSVFVEKLFTSIVSDTLYSPIEGRIYFTKLNVNIDDIVSVKYNSLDYTVNNNDDNNWYIEITPDQYLPDGYIYISYYVSIPTAKYNFNYDANTIEITEENIRSATIKLTYLSPDKVLDEENKIYYQEFDIDIL